MKILFFAAMLVAEHCAQTRFNEMQDDGWIVYEGEDEDTGEALFTIILSDTTIYYAHKTEAVEMLKTGTFKYNDFLK